MPVIRQVRKHGHATATLWYKILPKSLTTPRVGLMGNPSDGFNGKTIAMTIANFWAEVTLLETQTLVIQMTTYSYKLKHLHSVLKYCDLCRF